MSNEKLFWLNLLNNGVHDDRILAAKMLELMERNGNETTT